MDPFKSRSTRILLSNHISAKTWTRPIMQTSHRTAALAAAVDLADPVMSAANCYRKWDGKKVKDWANPIRAARPSLRYLSITSDVVD